MVDLAGVCQHLTYCWHDPSPIVDVSAGSQGGGIAIHAMLGGEFSSPHEQATMLVADQHWGKWVGEMTRRHFRHYLRPRVVASQEKCTWAGCLMPASLGCREYPVQPGDTKEVPAHGELVQQEPIFFHPLPAMHHPLAFLDDVKRMQK